ncbi:MAG: NADH-quinone oxidoreductase subunit G [Cocleimonas sp.]|nr:NADH-quinone oxidoreductase subunit G [Cocleimonas sp.]
MSETLITIEINAEKLEVKPDAMLIEVADDAGIHIPRFCYHNKLSIAANCRMCLVEVENAPKPMPACATPVNEGMKVWTRSKDALAAQRDNMEFLLINHPLDCPICDQGGECELQDLAVSNGGSSSSFNEIKRVVLDKDIGPLVTTEMTRCIQCTRCIRFGEEIAGMREMGATGRGDRMEVGTFVEKSLVSELSGNIIDICPVGALTAKPSRYKARPWDVLQTESIASHDSVGSSLHLHTYKGELIRVAAGENDATNECWISDRDRFSYQGVNSADRLQTPMIKKDGVWQEIDWVGALDSVAELLKAIDKKHIGALVSPRATLEEQYLLQKVLRSLDVHNIDHRLRQSDFYDQETAPVAPSLGVSIAELEQQDAVLLVGSNIRQEQPLLNHRLRKAALKGAHIMTVNSRHYEFNYDVGEQLSGNVAEMLERLAGIALASGDIPTVLSDLVSGIEPSEAEQQIVARLNAADNALVLTGSLAISHPQYSALRALSAVIAKNTGAKVGSLAEAANSVGAWLAGAVPHRQAAGVEVGKIGKNADEMLREGLKLFILLDVEPEFDCADPQQASSAMDQAECVVAITPFITDRMKAYADILLPAASFAETSGTFVNAEGRWQQFTGATQPLGDARPVWKILRVLGNVLTLDGFDYVSSKEVSNELKQAIEDAIVSESATLMPIYQKQAVDSGLQRISEVAMYCTDSLVRRATALHKSVESEEASIRLSVTDADNLGLNNGATISITQGTAKTRAKLVIDQGIPAGCVLIPEGTEVSAHLGASFGTVNISAT